MNAIQGFKDGNAGGGGLMRRNSFMATASCAGLIRAKRRAKRAGICFTWTACQRAVLAIGARCLRAQTWCSKERDSMTESERQAHKARIAAMQVQREVEEKKRHAKAATDCEKQWDLAKPCPAGGHPYLLAKGVKPYGVRLDGLGCLMVPAYIDAKLTSLQFIDEDGGKRFKTGGRVRGASFHAWRTGRRDAADSLRRLCDRCQHF